MAGITEFDIGELGAWGDRRIQTEIASWRRRMENAGYPDFLIKKAIQERTKYLEELLRRVGTISPDQIKTPQDLVQLKNTFSDALDDVGNLATDADKTWAREQLKADTIMWREAGRLTKTGAEREQWEKGIGLREKIRLQQMEEDLKRAETLQDLARLRRWVGREFEYGMLWKGEGPRLRFAEREWEAIPPERWNEEVEGIADAVRRKINQRYDAAAAGNISYQQAEKEEEQLCNEVRKRLEAATTIGDIAAIYRDFDLARREIIPEVPLPSGEARPTTYTPPFFERTRERPAPVRPLLGEAAEEKAPWAKLFEKVGEWFRPKPQIVKEEIPFAGKPTPVPVPGIEPLTPPPSQIKGEQWIRKMLQQAGGVSDEDTLDYLFATATAEEIDKIVPTLAPTTLIPKLREQYRKRFYREPKW